jgi:hypothetical protein
MNIVLFMSLNNLSDIVFFDSHALCVCEVESICISHGLILLVACNL